MNDIVKNEITMALAFLAPAYKASEATRAHTEKRLNDVAQVAWREGRNHALTGLMTAEDVAQEFDVSLRRATTLIENRHRRFGVGMRVHERFWLVHRDELDQLRPDERYQK